LAHDDAAARMKALTKSDSNQDVLIVGCEARLERARTGASVPELRKALADDLALVGQTCEKLVDDYPYIVYYRERLASCEGSGTPSLIFGHRDDT
jgi:hypothetical protein